MKRARREGSVIFEHFFDECESRSEIVATFLAILELIRAGRFEMTEEVGIITMTMKTDK